MTMAKINGPLMSHTATGALGKAVLFARPLGKQIARNLTTYSNRSATRQPLKTSPKQTAQRAAYRAACDWWITLPAVERAAFQAAADAAGISLFSAAISARLRMPPPMGTQWDAGTTTWDAGATTWDN